MSNSLEKWKLHDWRQHVLIAIIAALTAWIVSVILPSCGLWSSGGEEIRPHLTPTLELRKRENGSFVYWFKIENQGRESASSITLNEAGRGFETRGHQVGDISPKETIQTKIQELIGFGESRLELVLQLDYKGPKSGPFKSVYSFEGEMRGLSEGSIKPFKTSHGVNARSLLDRNGVAGSTTVDSQTNAMCVYLNVAIRKRRSDRAQVICDLKINGGSSLTISVDREHYICAYVRSPSGQESVLRTSLDGRSIPLDEPFHCFVQLGHDSSSEDRIELWIDGVLVSRRRVDFWGRLQRLAVTNGRIGADFRNANHAAMALFEVVVLQSFLSESEIRAVVQARP